MIREQVHVSGRGRHVFKCRFPFSWLIKDMVDDLGRGAADVSSKYRYVFRALENMLEIF